MPRKNKPQTVTSSSQTIEGHRVVTPEEAAEFDREQEILREEELRKKHAQKRRREPEPEEEEAPKSKPLSLEALNQLKNAGRSNKSQSPSKQDSKPSATKSEEKPVDGSATPSTTPTAGGEASNG